MKLLKSTENKITKDKNSENVPRLKIIEVVLFVPNKPFRSLLELSPKNQIFLKTFNSEFQDTRVWFTDQNSQPLEIEDRMNLSLVINWSIYYKNELFN